MDQISSLVFWLLFGERLFLKSFYELPEDDSIGIEIQ